jgi:hypothetical protein
MTPTEFFIGVASAAFGGALFLFATGLYLNAQSFLRRAVFEDWATRWDKFRTTTKYVVRHADWSNAPVVIARGAIVGAVGGAILQLLYAGFASIFLT